MMEVQEALNYLVLEYQTNHDFRWGLFTVGGVVLNAVLMLCVGRFGKSKPIAVEVDVLKSYEKVPAQGGSGTQPTPPLSDERKAYLFNMTDTEFAKEMDNGTLTSADVDYLIKRKKLIPTPKIATGVPPAPTPIEAPKPFSDLVEKLLALKNFDWGTEWSRHLQDRSKQNVDEYLAYQTGNVMVGFFQTNRLNQDPAMMQTICLVDSDTLIEKLPRDFTTEEWTALTNKFSRIREKVLAHEKQEVERKAMEIMHKTFAGPLFMYTTDRLKEEIKKREQKSV